VLRTLAQSNNYPITTDLSPSYQYWASYQNNRPPSSL
jgi:hypothetical protein